MRNQYSPSELVGNVFSLLLTKLTMPQARFVRRPVYIRGKRFISGCKGLTTGRFCRFDLKGGTNSTPTLHIGDNCEMGDMTHIVAHDSVKIGNNVLIASKCFISDTNHGLYSGNAPDGPESAPNKRMLTTKPVMIGNNVWIGENVVILPGSRICDGCIIGANSVVTGQTYLEPCIIAGVPAGIIKKWNAKENAWERIKELRK